MLLKDRLAAGETLLGAGLFSGSTELLEYSAAGMDWVWWDCQHSHQDWQTILHGVRTAGLLKIPVLIRTWTHDGGTIERLLDTGADGMIVPMVNTAAQAEQIVSHCYYPPLGNRSVGSARMERIEPRPDVWNQRMVVVMQLETPEAIENAEAIARVPGVDALHVGMRDLALRIGKEVNDYNAHEIVKQELDHVVRVCRAAGKAAAVIVSSPGELLARVHDGYRFICAGADLNLVEEGWHAMRDALTSSRSDDNPKHPE